MESHILQVSFASGIVLLLLTLCMVSAINFND